MLSLAQTWAAIPGISRWNTYSSGRRAERRTWALWKRFCGAVRPGNCAWRKKYSSSSSSGGIHPVLFSLSWGTGVQNMLKDIDFYYLLAYYPDREILVSIVAQGFRGFRKMVKLYQIIVTNKTCKQS